MTDGCSLRTYCIFLVLQENESEWGTEKTVEVSLTSLMM